MFLFQIGARAANNGADWKDSAGSRKHKSGGQDAKGRISVLRRRHGLTRSRYHGLHGMRRWVGLGVIADNLINIGRRLVPQTA